MFHVFLTFVGGSYLELSATSFSCFLGFIKFTIDDTTFRNFSLYEISSMTIVRK